MIGVRGPAVRLIAGTPLRKLRPGVVAQAAGLVLQHRRDQAAQQFFGRLAAGGFPLQQVSTASTSRCPTPGQRGLGIFLHDDMPEGYTEGCVALPSAELDSVLRWLNPADSPHILIAVG